MLTPLSVPFIVAEITLRAVATKMAKLDIAMLTTHTNRGQLSTRPMSNNGDVAYDGNSCYFTYEGSRTVRDITENPHVSLGFPGHDYVSVSVVGTATQSASGPPSRSTGCPSSSAGSRTELKRPAWRWCARWPSASSSGTARRMGR